MNIHPITPSRRHRQPARATTKSAIGQAALIGLLTASCIAHADVTIDPHITYLYAPGRGEGLSVSKEGHHRPDI